MVKRSQDISLCINDSGWSTNSRSKPEDVCVFQQCYVSVELWYLNQFKSYLDALDENNVSCAILGKWKRTFFVHLDIGQELEGHLVLQFFLFKFPFLFLCVYLFVKM